jgi:predicted PurR-regulated permease PerM
MYFASELLIPLTVAIVLNLVLTPVCRWAARNFIPPPVSAAVIVSVLIGLLAFGFYRLSEPVAEWMARAPEISQELQMKLEEIRRPVEKVKQASEEVEKVASVGSDDEDQQEVVVKAPGLLERLMGTLQGVGIQLSFTFVLLYFLLASGEMFKEKLVRVVPRLRDKKRAVLITRHIEKAVSSYLLTITAINVGLGFSIGTGLYVIGLPNALLWGVTAALLNFIPYFGVICGLAIVGMAGLITFDTIGHAALAPAIYAVMNLIESQFITPSVLGRRLTLNPVVIFIVVAFFGWIWGIPGALIGVPLLIVLKVLCDHVDSLAALGEFLSGRRPAS